MSSGGSRPGAGRKRSKDPRVVLSCRVKPETLAALQAIASSHQKGIGVLIDDMTVQWLTE